MSLTNKRRWIGVLVTTVFAVGLIVLLSIFNPTEDTDKKPTGVGVKKPVVAPPTLDKNNVKQLSTDKISNNQQGRVQRQDPKTGKLAEEFSWDTLNPESDGVFEITKPEAWMYLSPHRVIHMYADEARIVAPGNYPQSGEFRGHVVITLFECDDRLKRNVIVGDQSPDIALRIHLDGAAQFDTTLGTIGSLDELFFTSAQGEMQGRGMKLTYNQVMKRIDYFEITHGDTVRFAGKPKDEKKDAKDKKVSDVKAAKKEAVVDPASLQYYKVIFEHNVVIMHEGRRIAADTMQAWLSVKKNQDEDAKAKAAKVAEKPVVDGDKEVKVAEGGKVVGGDPRSLMKRTGNEATVNWRGRLVMTPELEKPSQLVEAEDLYVELFGKPMTILTDRGEQVVCQKVTYLDSEKLVRVIPSGVQPLVITSPDLGRLTSERLDIALESRTATLYGNGMIVTPKKAKKDAKGNEVKVAEGVDIGKANMPGGMTMKWGDRLVIVYADTKGEVVDKKAERAASGIERASFLGDVVFEDEQFAMRAGRLNATFSEVLDAKTKKKSRVLSQILAEGNVFVEVDDGLIEGKRIQLDLKPDGNGDPKPDQLLAEGQVYVIDKKQRLWANHLFATFVPKPARVRDAKDKGEAIALVPKDGKQAARKSYNQQLKTLVVEEYVRLYLVEEDTFIVGDKLEADAVAGTANLFGSPLRIYSNPDIAGLIEKDELAKLNDGTRLQVIELKIKDNGAYAIAEGPGEFHYDELLKADVVADANAVKKKDGEVEKRKLPRKVDVSWKTMMRMKDKGMLVDMEGDVAMVTRESPVDMNTLTARNLTLEMMDLPVVKKADAKAGEKPVVVAEAAKVKEDVKGEGEAAGGLLKGAKGTKRTLKKLIANKDVVLKAIRWFDESRKVVETRFRLTGDNLTFDDVSQVAQINGAGTLLMEDYRKEKAGDVKGKGKAGAGDDEKQANPIMSGKGASLFEWKENMTLDAKQNKLIMNGGVEMTHRPVNGAELLELSANRLVADMKDTKDIGANKMSRVESLKMQHILAEGNVQIRQGDRIISAPLQLYFNGDEQAVLLEGTAEHPVEVIDLKLLKPLRAKKIIWDLKRDRFEIVEGAL